MPTNIDSAIVVRETAEVKRSVLEDMKKPDPEQSVAKAITEIIEVTEGVEHDDSKRDD